MNDRPVMIGISGGSCSGKTSLAAALAGRLSGVKAVVISLDSYYLDLSSIKPEARARCNFDLPEMIDVDLASHDLESLSRGGTARIPLYDFSTHTRAPEEEWTEYSASPGVLDGSVVIIEGLFVLYFPVIRALLDLKVFIDLPHDVCLARRIVRDCAERGRSEDDVRLQYEKTVKPMFEKYVLPTRRWADMSVDGEGGQEKVIGDLVVRVTGE